MNLLILRLHDYQKEDLEAFFGKATFRVSKQKHFMVISPDFTRYSFDIIWSPVLARQSGEPPMEAVSQDTHLVFHFVLTDQNLIVKGLRSASISPDCGRALYRASTELRQIQSSVYEMTMEMQTVFGKYLGGFPDTFFHEQCFLGD
jgi:hypothetical protein